jgi:YbgC/YbaW family acyl-CoA thioester hydrolase
MNLRSFAWAPTISLSWFWGLSFFFSFHVTLTYGWLGFVGFAAPNALGLGLFGWVVGRAKASPDMIVKSFEGAYGGALLLFQFAAAAITIFGFTAYFWTPVFGGNAAIGVTLLVLCASAVGHALTLTAIKWLHAGVLAGGLLAAALLYFALSASKDVLSVPALAGDGRSYGLFVPILVGCLLGPWLDVRQWQRAAAIHRERGSARVAYIAAALLFFGLLTVNALLAAAAGGAGALVSSDGQMEAYGAVAFAAQRVDGGLHGARAAFAAWTTLALASTIDSGYGATRWFLLGKQRRSESALMALIPPGVASSPLWLLAGAAVVAIAADRAGLSPLLLALPFSTLFVGSAACLACEVLNGRRAYDPVLCFLIGCAAAIIFVVGEKLRVPILVWFAPLIGMIGALPAIIGLFFPQRPGRLVPTVVEEPHAPLPVASAAVFDVIASQGFDGKWFVMQMTPTYDDTNSVGNVYFANYVRWVGKARELFFNICIPNFDLKTTQFYILTRSFTHNFRRETREFEPITVRVRISKFNRKFVTLEHEILGGAQGLLGSGEQTLMFVDTAQYRPLDIPRDIVRGFLPYAPKDSRHYQRLHEKSGDPSTAR